MLGFAALSPTYTLTTHGERMTVVATNRVAAEFYQGIDFPSDWAEHPTGFIGVGLARNRVFSATVLLDAKVNPLAACWQAAGEAEKFVRIRLDDGVEDGLLDELDDDLANQSKSSAGHADLFATMLWEPKGLRPDQGIDVHPPRYGPFFDPIAEERGWSVATRELVAKASNLVLVTRRNATGLSIPVPSTAAEMHLGPTGGNGATFVVLPASSVL